MARAYVVAGSSPATSPIKNISSTMESLEKKVADAILERPSESLTIDGVEYPIAPPSPATLILVSELVAEIPDVKVAGENLMQEMLRTARDMKPVGKIAAVLILGAKRIREGRMVTHHVNTGRRRWSWRRLRMVDATRKVTESELDWLSTKILEEVTPKTLTKVVSKRLGNMEMADFFGLTVSLSGANLTRRTVEAETASGE